MTAPTPISDVWPARLAVAVIGLLAFAAWALGHAYRGLFHDAELYTLQALARLDPAGLGGDVFLRWGSQDHFTFFSPLYAAAARLLGVEPAAAWLTLLSQVSLVLAAWLLARTVMPAAAAVLGAGVFLALPGDYGALRIFTCIEPFLTPRMAAESLVLAGLAAALRGFGPLALGLVAAAALLHPLMALPGLAALYWLYIGERRPVIAAALAIVALKALVLLAWALPGAWGRFDADWLGWVNDRSPYLFLRNWSADDWARVAVPMATGLIACFELEDARGRLLSRVVVLSAAAGLILAGVAGDTLHLVLVTQMQPWRWLWPVTVVCAILSPLIVRDLWNADRAARTALLLLLAGWVFAANAYALAAAALALAAPAAVRRLRVNESRWVLAGAAGLLGIALTWRVATNLEFTDAHYAPAGTPDWIRYAASFTHDGIALAAAMFGAAWLAGQRRANAALAPMALGAGALALALVPYAWRCWTAREYPPRRLAEFAALRQVLEPGADVFWPESPLGAWMLLRRPSYLSTAQTSGIVFSRAGAAEMKRRADALRAAVPPTAFMGWAGAPQLAMLSSAQLETACATREFGYLATFADLNAAPVAVDPGALDGRHALKIYRCREPGR